MANISAEHKLYLYKLLCSEIGIGRQTMLSRVEEALLADDVWPCDLGCADVRELLESLDEFVRLSVFKKGRVYATVLSLPEWDALLEKAQKAQTKSAEPGGAKLWKRKRGKKDVVPVKPRPKGRPEVAAETEVAEPVAEAEAPEVERTSEPRPEVESGPEPMAEPTPEEPAITVAAEPEPASVSMPEPEPQTEPEAVQVLSPEPAPATETVPEAATSPEPAPADKPAPKPQLPEEPPSISFTITYDPYAEDESAEGASVLSPEPVPAAAPAQRQAPKVSQQSLPVSFAREVSIPDEHLSAMYQILPLDVDPYALLDEDLLVARSTRAVAEAEGTTTFPLRYVQADGTPVVVALRRTLPTPSGRRWRVTGVRTTPDASLDGLPQSGESTARELALFAHIGPWDELRDRLAELLGADDVLGSVETLQTYLGMTLHRIQLERKLRTYDDGSRAAFDTGLTTPRGESILMCFDACDGAIAWEFAGFRTPGDPGLGQELPEPASYVSELRDVAVLSDEDVEVSRALVRAHSDGIEDAIRVALRRAMRNYRLCTPAYDPNTNRLTLLLPFYADSRAADATAADCALVLSRTDKGLRASAIVSLERAAACARVVSLELPRWLRI